MLKLSLCTPPKARWLALPSAQQIRIEGNRLFADGELVATHEDGRWSTRNHQEFLILQAEFDSARISVQFESADSQTVRIGPFARVRIVHATISAGWPVELVVAFLNSETNRWSILNQDGSFDAITIAIDPVTESVSRRSCIQAGLPASGRPAKFTRRERTR